MRDMNPVPRPPPRSAEPPPAPRTRSPCDCTPGSTPLSSVTSPRRSRPTGGIVTALDVAESRHDRLVVDVTCSATDSEHADEIVDAVASLEGITVHKVSDRTFLLHIGGKIEVTSKVPLRTRDDLSMAYTPGVGRVSLALAEHPEDVAAPDHQGQQRRRGRPTAPRCSGLGNIGPGAALPVMEGKAALFKRFADIDAWPICLDTQDTDRIVDVVAGDRPRLRRHQPRGHRRAALLRDRARGCASGWTSRSSTTTSTAPRSSCWRRSTNALRCVDRDLADVRVVVAGAGAAGTAIVTLLLAAGAGDVVVWDREGCLSADDDTLSPAKAELARRTNPRRVRGDLRAGPAGADVFIGVSGPGVLEAEWIDDMGDQPIVFALANPDPEIDPAEAGQHAAVVASGRSDYPNQINNVLAFPGVFRGLLDARATDVTTEMLLRAATRSRHCVTDEELNVSYIIPSVFDEKVPKAVAAAIRGERD